MITITFEADETGPQEFDIQVNIPIVDDSIDEAREQVFVASLDIVSAFDLSTITITRQDSLCGIIDNDGE